MKMNESKRIDIDGVRRVVEHSDFGTITVYDVDGRTLYPARDCAVALGFYQPSGVAANYCPHREKWLEKVYHSKRLDGAASYLVTAKNYIPAEDVRVLIERSARQDKAELSDWLLSDVLETHDEIKEEENTDMTVIENEGANGARVMVGEVSIDNTESDYIDSRELRNRVIDRVEVLERVKALLLIPNLNMLTTQQVADFFEVDVEAVQKTYQRNKAEIDDDGVTVVKQKILYGQFVQIGSGKGGQKIFDIGNGQQITVSNAGSRMFSQRAILRIGMLLRDSRVAREVRTQLLNIAQSAAAEQRVSAINEEEQLLGPIIRNLVEGQVQDCTMALMEYVTHKNRRLKELEQHVRAQEVANEALCGHVTRWESRALVNALVRRLAYVRYRADYSYAWQLWRRTMYYQEGVTLLKSSGMSYPQQLKDEQWPIAIKVAVSLCLSANIDIEDILSHADDGQVALCEMDTDMAR